MEFFMTLLPLVITAAGCGIGLLIWIFRQKKEERKEFGSEIARLTVATLLSFSIALFSVSFSARWEVEQERKLIVSKLVSMYGEARENQDRIGRFRNDEGGEFKGFQWYRFKGAHADSFFPSGSCYRCSFRLQRLLGNVLDDLEPLDNQIKDLILSGGTIDLELAPMLENFEKTLDLYMGELETEGRKLDEKSWENKMKDLEDERKASKKFIRE